MSSTRHAAPGAEFSAERGLSSPKLSGINIGLNIVVRVAMAHTEPMRRAMIWLANYAAIHRSTADALAERLGLTKGDIRGALTDPEFEHPELFVERVTKFRREWEATLPALVETEVTREVGRAMNYALKKTKMIEIVGKTRMGKSESARLHWLRHLDRCLWFECPEDDTERGFFYELAAALGIGVSSAKKTGLFRAQCKVCFGPGGIECLIVDEAHRLWPSDVKSKPKRVEFLRSIYADGRGCSVVIIGTPQHTDSLNTSLDLAGRWAPGQYEGRVVRFHLAETMTKADLRAVAAHHGPEAGPDVVEALVEQALATQGYCGAMVETIGLAREVYGDLSMDSVTRAQLQQARGSRIEAMAKAAAAAGRTGKQLRRVA